MRSLLLGTLTLRTATGTTGALLIVWNKYLHTNGVVSITPVDLATITLAFPEALLDRAGSEALADAAHAAADAPGVRVVIVPAAETTNRRFADSTSSIRSSWSCPQQTTSAPVSEASTIPSAREARPHRLERLPRSRLWCITRTFRSPCGAMANAAKYLAGEAAFRACTNAVMTHGGMGYAKEYHVERYLREALIHRIAPITPNLVLCYLAERVLGLPKSY